MPIPILRLPYLVLKVVLSCADNLELLKLTLCSQKTGRIVSRYTNHRASILKVEGKKDYKSFNDLEKLELFLQESPLSIERTGTNPALSITVANELCLNVGWNNDCSFSIYPENLYKINQFKGVRKDIRFGDTLVPVIVSKRNKLCTFWSDKSDGLLCLMKFFKNNFKLKIEFLKIDGFHKREFSVTLKKVVAYVATQTVDRVVVCGSLKAEDYKLVLDNVKADGKFFAMADPPKNFDFDGKIQAGSVYISGDWFTFEQLLSADVYRGIDLASSKVSNKECRMILDHWLQGKFPKLAEIRLKMGEFINEKVLLKGLQVERRQLVNWGNSNPRVIGQDGARAKVTITDYPSDYFEVKFYQVPEVLDLL
ncbi:unnamed protein product [Caenorhabditis brenneri]